MARLMNNSILIIFLTIIPFNITSVTYPMPDINVIVEGKNLPDINIKNLTSWVGLSTKNWKTEIKKYDFEKSAPSKNGTYCTSHDGADFNVRLVIEKQLGGMIYISWWDVKGTFGSCLDNLVDEIEPYYSHRGTNNSHVYQYKSNSITYEITINKSLENFLRESVFIRKL